VSSAAIRPRRRARTRTGSPWPTPRSCSRAHLEFGLESNGQFWISDLHSTNGVVLERAGQAPQRCLPGYRVAIQPGDRVVFGGRILTITAR